MDESERAANLEFWSARSRDALTDEPPRPHKPYRHSRFGRLRERLPEIRLAKFGRPEVGSGESGRGRARPVAAGLLLAGLAGAWLLAGHQTHGSTAVTVVPPFVGTVLPTATSTSTTATPEAPTPAVPADAIDVAVVDTPACTGLSAARPHVRCPNQSARAAEEMALYTPGSIGEAFRKIAGAHVTPRSGSPACASGHPDERSWSIASAPQYAVGRYLCRLESGMAAMWWTHGDRLVHMRLFDSDLAALFAWWSAHPSE